MQSETRTEKASFRSVTLLIVRRVEYTNTHVVVFVFFLEAFDVRVRE